MIFCWPFVPRVIYRADPCRIELWKIGNPSTQTLYDASESAAVSGMRRESYCEGVGYRASALPGRLLISAGSIDAQPRLNAS